MLTQAERDAIALRLGGGVSCISDEARRFKMTTGELKAQLYPILYGGRT